MQEERSSVRKEGHAGDARKHGAPSLWSRMSHHSDTSKEGGRPPEGLHLPHCDDALVIRAWRRAVCLAQCITSVLDSSCA